MNLASLLVEVLTRIVVSNLTGKNKVLARDIFFFSCTGKKFVNISKFLCSPLSIYFRYQPLKAPSHVMCKQPMNSPLPAFPEHERRTSFVERNKMRLILLVVWILLVLPGKYVRNAAFLLMTSLRESWHDIIIFLLNHYILIFNDF